MIEILTFTNETKTNDFITHINNLAKSPTSSPGFTLGNVTKHTTEDKWWIYRIKSSFRNGVETEFNIKDKGGLKKQEIAEYILETIASGDCITEQFQSFDYESTGKRVDQGLIDSGYLTLPSID